MLYSMSNEEGRNPDFSLWCDAVIIPKPGLQVGSFMHLIITYMQNVLVLQCWSVYPYGPSHRQDSHLRNHYTNSKTVSHFNRTNASNFPSACPSSNPLTASNPWSVSLCSCLYLKLCTHYREVTQCSRSLPPRCHSFQLQSGLQGLLAIVFS